MVGTDVGGLTESGVERGSMVGMDGGRAGCRVVIRDVGRAALEGVVGFEKAEPASMMSRAPSRGQLTITNHIAVWMDANWVESPSELMKVCINSSHITAQEDQQRVEGWGRTGGC